jgi:hypothetical protein
MSLQSRGHSLRFAPCDKGREALACDINACGGKGELLMGLADICLWAHLHLCVLIGFCAHSHGL